jgi:hypothetical protein
MNILKSATFCFHQERAPLGPEMWCKISLVNFVLSADMVRRDRDCYIIVLTHKGGFQLRKGHIPAKSFAKDETFCKIFQ